MTVWEGVGGDSPKETLRDRNLVQSAGDSHAQTLRDQLMVKVCPWGQTVDADSLGESPAMP